MSSPAGSGGGSGGGGLGRSAPIRTVGGRGTIGGGVPTSKNSNTNVNSNIGIPSLPGSTPPLVKSKLALTPGRVGPSSSKPPSNNNAPPKYQSYDPYHNQPAPPPPPPVSAAQTFDTAQTLTSPIISTNNNTDDAIASSRITPGNTDPVVMSRQSPGVSVNTSHNSAQLQAHQPHIVPLPPNNPNLVTAQPTYLSHPLETSTTAAGGEYNHGKVQQQQNVYQSYSQQQSVTSAAINHPLKQTTSYAQQQPSQQRQTPSPTKQRNNAKPTSSDDEVDIFLKSGGVSNNLNNKLHPTPLPPTIINTLSKCKLLVERRAYGDVIRVTNDIFTSQDVGGKDPGKGDGGVYSRLYNELIQSASSSSASSTTNNESVRDGALSTMAGPTFNNDSAKTTEITKEKKLHYEEMSELLAIRFISQLKLRRYVDLGKEIELLGLMPYLPDRDGAMSRDGDKQQQQQPLHVRAISGIPTSMESASMPNTPGTPGTLGTETSIDILSSSTKEQQEQASSEKLNEKPLAWKEGSLHSSRASQQSTNTSWIPFGLRILAAHQLQYNDGSSKAIDVLYDLRDRATRTEYWNTNGMEIWKGVIDNALVNSFVRKREWRMALKSLDDLLIGLEDGVDREVRYWCTSNGEVNVSDTEKKQMKEIITSAARVELLSRQLLVLLQSGAIAAADMIHNDVRLYATMVQSQLNALPSNMTLLVRLTKEMALVRQVPIRQQINEGLLQFAQQRYNDAATHFRHALAQQRQLDSVITSTVTECPSYKDLSSPTLGFDSTPSLTVEALNNLSLCLLYSGNMRSAVTELEGLIREDPCVYLTEGLAFNLCTLYELGLDGEECTRKKKLLQRVGKRFYLHDIGVESFRLG